MPAFEAESSQFGLVGGMRQARSDMAFETPPAGLFSPEARKGRLYIVAETDPSVARGRDAAELVLQTIRRLFYDDGSYSVTSALRKALVAANKVLYEQNFSAPPQRRALVGVSCAVLKGDDLYIAQVQPAQAFVLAGGKLRSMPTMHSASALFKSGAVGASLSVEPEFFRATLAPGDALLLCSSNLAGLLDRAEHQHLLREPNAGDLAERLAELCAEQGIADAHGLAVAIRPALSPAAQAEPLSRAGVSERGRLALRSLSSWGSRITADAALLLRGGARAQRRRAETRHQQALRERETMAQLPEQPPDMPNPIPAPQPLELGESLDQRLDQERQIRRTRLGAAPMRSTEDAVPAPSRTLGEDDYGESSGDRRIDLSDTPGMASLGRFYNARGRAERPDLTAGERLMQPFGQLAGALSRMRYRRRVRRPPPRALPRRSGGLSYRRQAPPFPWQWFLVLVLVVAAAVLYGLNLSRDIAQRRANDTLGRAATAVAALAGASEQNADSLLDAASVALEDVRATGAITSTTENRQRYQELQREYERIQAAVQKLTYFDDLELVAEHPVPNGLFSSVVVPPPPQGITATLAFAQIYLLDTNAGVLYQQPRAGGPISPLLRPQDTIGPLVVGQVRAQAWREDSIVAVAQSGDAGPFTFYFRTGDGWGYNTLAGSETWGRVNERFRAVNYLGNLYIWGGGQSSDQVQKYISGSYGQFPEPWIKDSGGQKTANALDLAIDGDVYLLMPNSHILVFSGSAFRREIVPQGITPALTTPAGFFVTGDPERGTIFLVDFNQRIVEIDKQTGQVIQQVRARPDSPYQLEQMTSLYVDDAGARPVLYLVNGGQVLRGSLPDRPRPLQAPTSGPAPTQAATPAP